MRYRTYLITFMLMAVVLTTAWGDDGSTLDLKKHKRENIFNSLSKMMPTTYLYKSMFHHSGPKPGPDPEPEPTPKADIHLHVVPHSHTDAGWIETIDWYYERKVKGIFDNIVAELYQDSDMTFVWADTNFLHQWYESQGEKVQKKFDKIVKRGQIEFVGGGWVQNDESLSDLKSIEGVLY